jgi:hypothetical protein
VCIVIYRLHFSGTFKENRRKEELEKSTSIICLDFDDLENPQWLKQKLSGYPYVISVFLSPNLGVKALILVRFEDDNQLKRAFDSLSKELKGELEIEPDQSGKDITRLCFASYDPEIFINRNVEYFEVEYKDEQIPSVVSTAAYTDQANWQLAEKVITQIEEKRADITSSYQAWRDIAFALTSEFGEQGRQFFLRISKFHPKFNAEECNKMYSDCLIHKGSGVTIRSFYYYAKKNGIEISAPPRAMAKLVIALDELMKGMNTTESTPFIWSGIRKGAFGFIFGPSKSGKTILCENLGMILAAGGDSFLGLPVLTDNHKVLFISLEEHITLRTQRNSDQVKYLKENFPEGVGDRYHVAQENFPQYLNNGDDWRLLEFNIVESGANFVIIDSLTRMSGGGDIEKSTIAASIAGKLREMTYKLGITMVVIHHTPKLNGARITMDSIAGSRVLSQEADFMIAIERLGEGVRCLREIEDRYKAVDTTDRPFIINDHKWAEIGGLPESPESTVKIDGRLDDTNTEEVFECVVRQSSANKYLETYASEIIKELVEEKRLMSKQTVYSHLKILEERGRLKKFGRGVYYIPSTNTQK